MYPHDTDSRTASILFPIGFIFCSKSQNSRCCLQNIYIAENHWMNDFAHSLLLLLNIYVIRHNPISFAIHRGELSFFFHSVFSWANKPSLKTSVTASRVTKLVLSVQIDYFFFTTLRNKSLCGRITSNSNCIQ